MDLGASGYSRSRALGRKRARGRTAILAAVCLLSVGVDASQAGDSRPNVVVVLTDDQRVGTVRRMPILWSLIRQNGVLFRNAMVPTSNCCPSRASILTGRYAHSTGVYSNQTPYGGWRAFHDRGMENRTIAIALHNAGYRTGLVGKYLNGGFTVQAAAGYVPPGWDYLLTFTDHVGYYNYTLTDGTTHGALPRNYSTDVLRRRAVRFIRSTPAEQPLFLYFAPFGPHRPYTPAPRHKGYWTGRLPSYRPPSVTENVGDKPPWIRQYSRVRQSKIDSKLAKAQDALMSVDEALGRIAGALEDTGRMSNTLFIFLSDNGLLMGEHHLFSRKNLPYKQSTSIPMIVRWDGHVAPNSVDSRLALNVDLARTIARAAGVRMTTEGLDLLGSDRREGFPLEATKRYPRDSAPDRPAYCGYRLPEWLYVQYATGEQELYSYEVDPHELQNLAGDARYQQRLDSLRTRAVASCRPLPPDFVWP